MNIDLLPEYPGSFSCPTAEPFRCRTTATKPSFSTCRATDVVLFARHARSNLHNYGPAVMYDTGKIAYIGGGYIRPKNFHARSERRDSFVAIGRRRHDEPPDDSP